MDLKRFIAPNRTRAWFIMTIMLTLHVIDEAVNDYLEVYNPTVQALKQKYGILPFPTLEFDVWLISLILTVMALFAVSHWTAGKSRWMYWLSYMYAAIMLLNGALHLIGSLMLGQFIAGSYTAFLLIPAALYLFYSNIRGGWGLEIK